MKLQKRQKYISDLYVATHTISGISEERLNLAETERHSKISESYHKRQKDRENEVTYLRLNPNKSMAGNEMIQSYELFKEVLEQIFEDVGGDIEKFHIRRADLSINSDTAGDFELYKKLNRLILCCISVEYDVINTYESSELFIIECFPVAILGLYLL